MLMSKTMKKIVIIDHKKVHKIFKTININNIKMKIQIIWKDSLFLINLVLSRMDHIIKQITQFKIFKNNLNKRINKDKVIKLLIINKKLIHKIKFKIMMK